MQLTARVGDETQGDSTPTANARTPPHNAVGTHVMEVVPLQDTPDHAVEAGSQGSTLALAWLCQPWVMPVHPGPLVAMYKFTSP